MKEYTEHGLKVRAGQLLSRFLKEIANEKTELVRDPETGEDRLATKAEALARLIWQMALGWREAVKTKKGVMEEIIHHPDKAMIHMIFDRLEGRIPYTTVSGDKKKIPVSQRMSEESKKRINALAKYAGKDDS